MKRFGHATGAVRLRCVLGLLVTLAGCVAWTNPAKPSSAFADDAAACKAEVV